MVLGLQEMLCSISCSIICNLNVIGGEERQWKKREERQISTKYSGEAT